MRSSLAVPLVVLFLTSFSSPAQAETEKTHYEMVAAAADGKPGKARPLRTYKLTPRLA